MKRIGPSSVAAIVLFALAGCSLDLQNPNLPTEAAATSSTQSISQVAVGLQAEYANELVNPVYVTGMVTDEIGAGGATFQSYQILDSGDQQLDNNLGPSEDPWAGEYLVVRDANVLLQDAPNVGFGAATLSGIIALAKLFKAMAFGNLLQLYQQIPLNVGPQVVNPPFATRTEALDTVLALLQEATTQIQTTPPSSDFNSGILAPGFDLTNTLYAMTARYALIAGNTQLAMQAAQSVDLSAKSVFEYTANDPNPLYTMWYSSGNAYQMRPKDSFRSQAEAGDQRVGYWVTPADIQGAVSALDEFVQFTNAADSYYAYFPAEMRLIQAEVLARQGDLNGALQQVNEVRTECTSTVGEPTACLPPLPASAVSTQQAMLDEILHEREYSLYLQGVRWSDLRRFGKPVKFDFMSVPRSECDRNSAAPRALCGPTLPAS
jgi:starch-binding outer membrane protein, SusD/RagB family